MNYPGWNPRIRDVRRATEFIRDFDPLVKSGNMPAFTAIWLPNDRGVVALLCRRFTEDPYRRYLPRDWYDEDPAELVAADPEESVREFFAR